MLDEKYIKESIKEAEGFRNKIYLCTEGFETIGYGHKCIEPHWDKNKIYTTEELNKVFKDDFAITKELTLTLLQQYECAFIQDEAYWVLCEMVFQMGRNGVSKFKNMFKALQKENYKLASKEMLDSKWYRQTPNRAKKLSNLMKSIV